MIATSQPSLQSKKYLSQDTQLPSKFLLFKFFLVQVLFCILCRIFTKILSTLLNSIQQFLHTQLSLLNTLKRAAAEKQKTIFFKIRFHMIHPVDFLTRLYSVTPCRNCCSLMTNERRHDL